MGYRKIFLGVCVLVNLLGGAPCFAQDLGNRSTTLFGGVEEWSLANPSWSGNPFDLDASVTYTHQGIGQSITHPMFYDGSSGWRFRFNGSKVGDWSFTTSSSDPQLNGRSGTISVAQDPDARGFTVGNGTKYAQQTGTGLNPLLPQYVMYERRPKNYATGSKIDNDIQTYFNNHGFTGFHAPSLGGYWFDFDRNDNRVNSSMRDPDPRTFDALERLIRKAHDAGGLVHIWAWGDTSRSQTPDSLSGGKNGSVDRRLQKYIAARLGPVPGWTMGYGFDLNEWAGASGNPSFVKSWADNINGLSGWDHLLGGRADGPNSSRPFSLDVSWNTNFGYAGYEHHKPDYDDYVRVVEARHDGQSLDRPVLSEDRFRLRTQGRSKDYSEAETRRGLWQATMAGGVANIWGNLVPRGNDDERGSAPYGNREQIKTWSTFWVGEERFAFDLQPANNLTGSGAVALSDPLRKSIYLYEENTSSIPLNLSGINSVYDVFAVDTKQGYNERLLGQVSSSQAINLPYQSDWALSLVTDGGIDPPDPNPIGEVLRDSYRVGNAGDDNVSLTIGDHENRMLLVSVTLEDNSNNGQLIDIARVTFGGTEMSLATENQAVKGGRAIGSWIYFLPDPQVGTGEVSVEFDSSTIPTDVAVGALSLHNVDTSVPLVVAGTTKPDGDGSDPNLSAIATAIDVPLSGAAVFSVLADGGGFAEDDADGGMEKLWGLKSSEHASAGGYLNSVPAGPLFVGWSSDIEPGLGMFRAAHSVVVVTPIAAVPEPTSLAVGMLSSALAFGSRRWLVAGFRCRE